MCFLGETLCPRGARMCTSDAAVCTLCAAVCRPRAAVARHEQLCAFQEQQCAREEQQCALEQHCAMCMVLLEETFFGKSFFLIPYLLERVFLSMKKNLGIFYPFTYFRKNPPIIVLYVNLDSLCSVPSSHNLFKGSDQ